MLKKRIEHTTIENKTIDSIKEKYDNLQDNFIKEKELLSNRTVNIIVELEYCCYTKNYEKSLVVPYNSDIKDGDKISLSEYCYYEDMNLK